MSPSAIIYASVIFVPQKKISFDSVSLEYGFFLFYLIGRGLVFGVIKNQDTRSSRVLQLQSFFFQVDDSIIS